MTGRTNAQLLVMRLTHGHRLVRDLPEHTARVIERISAERTGMANLKSK